MTLLNNRFNFIDLFAGAGGLSLGLSQAGLNPSILVDKNKDCIETLKLNNHGKHLIEGDICKLSFANYEGKVDLLVGGIPCQPFSYAGKGKGFLDERGNMFAEFFRILQQTKPKMFLIENVKGLVSHNDGETLQYILSKISELNYNFEYFVLNANDYGVAQNRERLFIVGRNWDYITSTIRPQKENRLVLKNVLPKETKNSEGFVYKREKHNVMELVPQGGCWRNLPENIAKEYMGSSYYQTGGRTGIARRLSMELPSPTLVCTPNQKQTELCHPIKTRPLNIEEYAAIQSFPEDWKFYGSTSSKYKQIGNAVPVNLARRLGLGIVECLERNQKLCQI